MLRHFGGHFLPSSRDLLEAERLIDEAFTRSVSEDILVWLSNDNAREYAGEDFEDIYLSVFNALNFYNQGNLEGALVEIRKLTMDPAGKLPQLATKYENARKGFAQGLEDILNKVGISLLDAMPAGDTVSKWTQDYGTFSDSALAHYLSVIFYMANGNYDSARIEYDRMQAAFASNSEIYHYPIPAAATDMLQVPTGMGRLNVLAFNGPSATKEEISFEASFPFMVNPELRTPTFRLPIMHYVYHTSGNVDRVQIEVNGQSVDLEPIEDIERVIFATFNQQFTDIYFRTFVRVLTRYIAGDIAATEAAKAAADNAPASVPAMVTGRAVEKARHVAAIGVVTASDALEGADLRMSRFLPSMARVGAIDLEPGTYDVAVKYFIGSRLYRTENRNVEVTAGGANLLQTTLLR
jgi:hypothetical protein